MTGIVAILTDFGLRDTYVGTMKAVMLSIEPGLQLVDITHAIEAQNVREGAFALLNSYSYFPAGTVFCVVIDPGVGSARLPIAVSFGGYFFVAPDNGVLSFLLSTTNISYSAVALEELRFRRSTVSRTFHGRDIFAPAAAHLATSPHLFNAMGKELDTVFTFPAPQFSFGRERLTGEVVHIDHFGNMITSIGKLSWLNDDNLELDPLWHGDIPSMRFAAAATNTTIHSQTIHGISHAYHEAPLGEIIAQIDSNGFLEIGANHASAAERLDVQLGDKVMLKLQAQQVL